MRRGHAIRAGVASLGALLLAKALVSCVDLASLGDGPPDGAAAVDAASDASGDGAIKDPCLRAAPPSRPPDAALVDGSATELPTFVLALDVVTLDPTKVEAFDLDGVCTCDGRPGTARDGGASCVSPMITCDLDGGADDAVGIVATNASPLVAIEKVSNRLIALGQRTVLVQIAKYNGLSDDDEVVVGSVLAEGIHAQGCPSSTQDPSTLLWSRGGCGDDPWTASPSAVIATGGSGILPLVAGTGYVRDYQLVVRFAEPARLPFNDESTIPFGTPLLTGKLVPLDESLAPRDPRLPPTEKEKRLFRLEGGVLAGRVLVTDMLATLGTYRSSATGTPLCASSAFGSIRTVLCGAPDIASAPAAGPSARCDALSAALGFVAIPALLADVADASVTSSACASIDASLLACP